MKNGIYVLKSTRYKKKNQNTKDERKNNWI